MRKPAFGKCKKTKGRSAVFCAEDQHLFFCCHVSIRIISLVLLKFKISSVQVASVADHEQNPRL